MLMYIIWGNFFQSSSYSSLAEGAIWDDLVLHIRWICENLTPLQCCDFRQLRKEICGIQKRWAAQISEVCQRKLTSIMFLYT